MQGISWLLTGATDLEDNGYVIKKLIRINT